MDVYASAFQLLTIIFSSYQTIMCSQWCFEGKTTLHPAH